MKRYDLFFFLNFIETDEDAITVNEICQDFKCREVDDFIRPFVLLLFKHPMSGGIKNAFLNADSLDTQIGICTRHLIKVAKKVEVPQFIIDRFVRTKEQRNFWVEHGTETMKRKHDEVQELKESRDPDAMHKLYYIGIDHTKAKTTRDRYRFFLRSLTMDLIYEVIERTD